MAPFHRRNGRGLEEPATRAPPVPLSPYGYLCEKKIVQTRLTLNPSAAHFPRLHGGAVAQLGERLVRNEEVRGSIPLSSTTAGRSPSILDCFWHITP
jgi:hypothetical protein